MGEDVIFAVRHFVEQAIKEGTGDRYQPVGQENGLLLIRMPDGEIRKKPFPYLMQELTRSTPSAFFTYRKKILPEKISLKGELYAEIKKASEQNGVWFRKDLNVQGKERVLIANYIQWMLQRGYIYSYGIGIYSINLEVDDRIIIEQKYIQHGDEESIETLI